MFKHQIGEKFDIVDFDHVMVVGSRRAGLSIFLLIFWDF